MDIFFLGTGAGVPAKLRNVTSIALKLLEERGAVWLFDCGEATQHQILHTSIKPRRIEKIFITHLHGDHIYGLPGLLASRSFQGGESLVTVYGPPGIKDYLNISLKVSRTCLRYHLEIIEIDEGTVFEDEQFTVEARLLDHGIASYGYRIVEKDRPGTLMVDKLKAEGLKPGPEYKKIKEGIAVKTDDGRVLNPSDFLGPPQKGRIIAILGDTRPCEAGVFLAQNASLLIHEATFSGNEEELAREYFHSTTIQAGKAAKKAQVKKLCLTHISSRYDKEGWAQLAEEARTVFPETIIAEDFMEVPISIEKK
ncbi:ribonuclease Z [Mesobacillus foraminis]|uniref:ribonuclease Z n=1 Tax=Mesobacillus foraminis TaxID=279826 RepID=UPI001BEC521E|nr:ribonuclease Z [Mesobacillus foraminis]MBT2754820.1 ribonuclease Z [Mesobacillus foraminis]